MAVEAPHSTLRVTELKAKDASKDTYLSLNDGARTRPRPPRSKTKDKAVCVASLPSSSSSLDAYKPPAEPVRPHFPSAINQEMRPMRGGAGHGHHRSGAGKARCGHMGGGGDAAADATPSSVPANHGNCLKHYSPRSSVFLRDGQRQLCAAGCRFQLGSEFHVVSHRLPQARDTDGRDAVSKARRSCLDMHTAVRDGLFESAIDQSQADHRRFERSRAGNRLKAQSRQRWILCEV